MFMFWLKLFLGGSGFDSHSRLPSHRIFALTFVTVAFFDIYKNLTIFYTLISDYIVLFISIFFKHEYFFVI